MLLAKSRGAIHSGSVLSVSPRDSGPVTPLAQLPLLLSLSSNLRHTHLRYDSSLSILHRNHQHDPQLFKPVSKNASREPMWRSRHVLLGGEAEETGYRGHRHLSGKLLISLSTALASCPVLIEQLLLTKCRSIPNVPMNSKPRISTGSPSRTVRPTYSNATISSLTSLPQIHS